MEEIIAEDQTSAVNALRDFFGIDEAKIPCLVFTSLTNSFIRIVPISGNDIYSYFKCLFNIIVPQLKQLTIATDKLQKLLLQENRLEKQREVFVLSKDKKIVTLYYELLAIADADWKNRCFFL